MFSATIFLVSSSSAQEKDSKVKEFSLRQLVEHLDSAPRRSYFFGKKEENLSYDAVLAEIIRRGGAAAAIALQDKLKKDERDLEPERQRLEKINYDKEGDRWRKQYAVVGRLQNNLELLTALRRVQKKSDPLEVVVTVPRDLKATTKKLPVFAVALRSADIEKIPVWIKHGGDYRSGRQARWRFEVRDPSDKALPVRPCESEYGGGMHSEGPLQFGETWETSLPMNNFVDILEPGRYTVTVLYHNSATIADITAPDELADLIICRSKPFTLNVEREPKRVVQLCENSRKKAEELTRMLADRGLVKIVDGNYGKDFYEFISPNGPEGQLLRMDWQAVPQLLDTLEDSSVSRHKKAWVLGLLYTITAERDLNPTKFDSVLPSYRCDGPGCSHSRLGGQINDERQEALISNWMKWKQEYLDIREAKRP
jgi:hypothetical protein